MSTRVWDTFAEPNIYTIPSEANRQNQATSHTPDNYRDGDLAQKAG